MAILSDLTAKRSELNQAVADYQQAVNDFNDASITQTQLDAARSAAETKGDEYAKLTAQVKQDDPSVTDDSQLFSNPSEMDVVKRADVAKIIRFGRLNTGIDDHFVDGVVDVEKWISTITGSGTSLSFYDAGTGEGNVLRMSASTRYNGENHKVRLETIESWPVGTSFKVRLKETGSYSIGTYLSLINETLGTRLKYQTNNQDTYVGQYLDEDGNSHAGLKIQYNDGETTFTEFELKWVDETTLEWYKNGALLHTTNAAFASDHKFVIEFWAANYGNWVMHHLDIDFITITPP